MVHRWTITCCFLMKMITDVHKKERFNRHNELENRIALITAVYCFFLENERWLIFIER